MVKNITVNDRLETNDTRNPMFNETSSRDEFTRERPYVLEDPIVLAILGVLAIIVIVIVFRAVINKFISRREHTHPSESAMSYYNNDPPPPYPGKHHETSFNYLPSYDSALAIEQRRRQTLEQACLTEGVSVDFSLSSETGVANNTDSQISTDASEAVPK
ncbi:uncharacterized protein LOC111110188 [Crassostrea virginica]